MPVVLSAQPASHPFAEAFSYLPTPTLLLDNDGNIVAGSVGLAELMPAIAAPLALVGRPLPDAQSQLGPVGTAWAYAHSVVRSMPWVQPPALLPVASPAGAGMEVRWWQPSLTRINLGDQTSTYWLATAHNTALPAPVGTTTPFSAPKSDEAAQLRDALAHVPGYIVTLHGPEHRISYVGPNVAALLGQNQLLGRLAANVLAELQATDSLQALNHTYQTGQPTAARELVLPDANNQPRYFNVSLQPLRDASQQITGVLVFGQDVTSRVQQAGAAAPAPYQDIVEHLPQITSISSAEGVVEYLSPQWFTYTGQSTDALHNHDWVDALNSEDWAQILHELPEHLSKGEPWNWDARIRRHDGVYRRHIAQMVPARNEAGQVVRWFGTMTDVQDLQPPSSGPSPNADAPDPCQELTDTLPQLLWTVSPDGATATMNKAATSYMGSEVQQRPGESIPSLFPGSDVVQALVERQHNFTVDDTWEYQSQLRRHDGEMRWFLHRAQPLRNAEGKIVKWYGSSTDIQTLKQEATQLQQQNEHLIRSNRELDAFVKSAADELRQPIHNLQALFGQMREAVTFHDPDANALLVMADNSLSRWNTTVRNLIQLVKAQEQHQLPPEELSLATLTREALLGLHPHLRASGGEVSTHFQSLPTVSYVRPHLLSIITNLLSNSIKQHDPSRPLRLRLESKPGPAGRAQLVVQDNGLGLEPSRVAGRTSRSSQQTNSAAGLYLINRIVEDHGGSLDVESVPGQGTTFRVTL
ncbi:PAS domain-containing protein [Hymenobacter sp. BT186]|uniref:histidine kinase n=1 Tax=Hymenobacter telluris TaxID=2816474 RepID=A0A939ETW8_9BACT|nr:PAS domain-containing protein [Hymenobacter telluris]MBO0357079.1 PAS domain-containing protein [Hymenobacter telluris]MBW3373106.1 PAS domain-containing protein [Hymenobacter norwichensis]